MQLPRGAPNGGSSRILPAAYGLKLDPIEKDGKGVSGIFRLGAQTVSLQGRAHITSIPDVLPEGAIRAGVSENLGGCCATDR